jgi:hypothetical protein
VLLPFLGYNNFIGGIKSRSGAGYAEVYAQYWDYGPY